MKMNINPIWTEGRASHFSSAAGILITKNNNKI